MLESTMRTSPPLTLRVVVCSCLRRLTTAGVCMVSSQRSVAQDCCQNPTVRIACPRRERDRIVTSVEIATKRRNSGTLFRNKRSHASHPWIPFSAKSQTVQLEPEKVSQRDWVEPEMHLKRFVFALRAAPK